MTPRQDHCGVLPPVDYRSTGRGQASPTPSGAARGLGRVHAHPIPRVDDATVLPLGRRIPGSHALIPSEVTTGSFGLRVGGAGLFFQFTFRDEFGDQAVRDGSEPFHASQHGEHNVRFVGKSFQTNGEARDRRE